MGRTIARALCGVAPAPSPYPFVRTNNNNNQTSNTSFFILCAVDPHVHVNAVCNINQSTDPSVNKKRVHHEQHESRSRSQNSTPMRASMRELQAPQGKMQRSGALSKMPF